MVCGPEIARCVNEFESNLPIYQKDNQNDHKHHEQTESQQGRFSIHLSNLIQVISEFENPFLKTSTDLLVLDTRNIADENVICTVNSNKDLGKKQFNEFVQNRLSTQVYNLYDPIKKNKLPLFSKASVKKTSTQKVEIKTLEKNCQLFSQLYVACQIWNGKLDDFFHHENHSFPPSLSKNGDIRTGNKFDLIECLEAISGVSMVKTFASCIVLDGPAIVNILQPRDCSTFKDYSLKVFCPFLSTQLEACERIDIISDRYFKNTLKTKARKKRGSGVRRRVPRDSKIPGNWQAFLRVDESKEELFKLLATESVNMKTNKIVISSKGESIVSNNDLHGSLFPCTQEEADTRIFLHVKNASTNGHSTVLFRSIDTEVVVTAIALYQKLETFREFRVWFGTGKNQRFIPRHSIAESLGKTKSLSLPMFHSVTGCYQISFFAGRGKKNAWNTWTKYEELTKAFVRLSYCPTKEDVSEVFPIIE